MRCLISEKPKEKKMKVTISERPSDPKFSVLFLQFFRKKKGGGGGGWCGVGFGETKKKGEILLDEPY